MLAYAFHYFRFNIYEEIKGEKFENIHDLFAEILIRGVSYQIKQGLYKTYVNKGDNLSVIRGRIDILKTYTIQRTNPFHAYCNYDELTENNPYNQVVKTTLHFLLKCTNVDENRKNSIRNLLHFFDTIDLVNLKTISFEHFNYDHNNQNYQMLLNICHLIFENMLMTTKGGNYKLRSLSDFQMSRLFEKFVLEYYKKHHPETKASAAQIGWNIVEEATDTSVLPIMQSDVLLSLGQRTLIIDTKYYSKIMQEQYGKETLRNNHLYQIRTYVDEYDRNHLHNVDGMLLYAKTKEDDFDEAQITHRDGYTLYIRTLDLNTDFEAIKKRLESFVEKKETGD